MNGNVNHRYCNIQKIEPHTTYGKAVKMIDHNSKVLEVGIGEGIFGSYLKNELKCEVHGLDNDITLIEKQRMNDGYDFLYNYDLNYIHSWIDDIEDDKYDYIVLMDVLEHIINPPIVINLLTNKLNNKGNYVISIPNISHNSISVNLVQDIFPYLETGLLDYSHLRFYTKKSFSDVLHMCGLGIVDYDYTYMIPEDSTFGHSYFDIDFLHRESLLNKPNGHILQNIFKCEKLKDGKNYKDINSDDLSHVYCDFIRLYESNNFNIFVNDQNCNIKHKIRNDINKIILFPTMRLRKYKIRVFINGDEFFLSSLHFNVNRWKDNEGYITGHDEQFLEINYPFRMNDTIEIIIIYEKYNKCHLTRIGDYKLNTPLNTLKTKIDSFDTITFDIFDTLMFRNIYKPTDIFMLMEKILYNKYNICDFYCTRIECERKARKKSNNYEATFEDIYNNIKDIYPKRYKEIKRLELDLEYRFIVENPFIREAFNYAINKNKRVLLITDMYLPKAVIKNMLTKCGYDGYEEIYLSCEIKKSKHIGDMYSHVKEICCIETEKWLHIGDNVHSDINNANKFGIETYYFKNVRKYLVEMGEPENISESILRGIQNNTLYNGFGVDFWEKFGILYTSPIFFAFGSWLEKLSKENDDIQFLSRDGYFCRKVFDLICQEKGRNVKSNYLYTSRRVFQISNLVNVDKNVAVDVLTQWNEAWGQVYYLKEALEVVELDISDYYEVLPVFKLDVDTVINHETLHNCRKFFSYIFDDVKKVLDKKNVIIQKYLKQNNFNESSKIMDIGWRGSIQDAIMLILGYDCFGYYFATNQFAHPSIMSNSYGFALDLGVPWENQAKLENNIMMYEFIFSAPHGSLLDLKEENDKIVPIFEDESRNYIDAIESMQSAALETIRKYLDYAEYIDDFDFDNCTKNYEYFIKAKDYEALNEFKKLSTNAGYSTLQTPFVKTYSIDYIRKNKEEFYKDIEKSFWKNAFLVEGIDNKHDHKNIIKEVEKYTRYIDSLHLVSGKRSIKYYMKRYFKKYYIIKVIKNPLKAIKIVKNKIFN